MSVKQKAKHMRNRAKDEEKANVPYICQENPRKKHLKAQQWQTGKQDIFMDFL